MAKLKSQVALILLTFVATDLRRRSGVIRGFKAAGNTAPGQQPDINLGLSALTGWQPLPLTPNCSAKSQTPATPRGARGSKVLLGPHRFTTEAIKKSNRMKTRKKRTRSQRPGILAPALHPRSALHWSRGRELGVRRSLEVGWGLLTSPPSLSPSQPSLHPERCSQHSLVRMRPEAWLSG